MPIEYLSKIDRLSMEYLSNIYRIPIERLSSAHPVYIGSLSNIYRRSIEHLLIRQRASMANISDIYKTFYRYSVKMLLNIYQTSNESLLKFERDSIDILLKLISLRNSRRGTSRLRSFEASRLRCLVACHIFTKTMKTCCASYSSGEHTFGKP